MKQASSIKFDWPLIGLGTWGMGGKFERDDFNVAESVAALRAGLDLGFRLIDTAELYGEGLAEELVGEAIRGRSRQNLIIVSKVSRDHLKRDDLLAACEGSLKRLGVDYLDVYLIHKLNYEQPVSLAETMAAMEDLVNIGQVKMIGASNFSLAELKEAAGNLKNVSLSVLEAEYNLLNRDIEKSLLPFCRQWGIKIIAQRPLVKGLLRVAPNSVIADLATRYHKSPAQIALNWLICQGVIPIPKASDVRHLKENFETTLWRLSGEDIKIITESCLVEI